MAKMTDKKPAKAKPKAKPTAAKAKPRPPPPKRRGRRRAGAPGRPPAGRRAPHGTTRPAPRTGTCRSC